MPIVFVPVGNPVGIGLAQSLSRPGGNATAQPSHPAWSFDHEQIRDIGEANDALAAMKKDGALTLIIQPVHLRIGTEIGSSIPR